LRLSYVRVEANRPRREGCSIDVSLRGTPRSHRDSKCATSGSGATSDQSKFTFWVSDRRDLLDLHKIEMMDFLLT